MIAALSASLRLAVGGSLGFASPYHKQESEVPHCAALRCHTNERERKVASDILR
jgi:hypothetical protein